MHTTRVAIASLLLLMLITTVSSAWEVSKVEYNTSTSTMKVCLDLSPIERLISFFVGGDYTRSLIEDYISGNYSFVYVGYDCSYLKVNGSITFTEPVNISIVDGNETVILNNVTHFAPANLTVEKID